MSKRAIVSTWTKMFVKALKMSPHHYKTVGKVFYKSFTTGCGWKKEIEELLASNMAKLMTEYQVQGKVKFWELLVCEKTGKEN
jgi:hypothetical protein